jgi:two-component system cell cycle sensor histidine kinase/response regulator CckA
MNWWPIVAAANAVVALAYLAISLTIVRNIPTDRRWRDQLLVIATAAIFFTCAVHHGSHTVHMLGPTLGFEVTDGRAMRVGFNSYHIAVWDILTAAVGVWYWTLRSRLPALVGSAALFEDLRQREQVSLQARERVEQLMAGLGEGFVALDHQGVVTYANDRAFQLLAGTTLEVGRPATEAFATLSAATRDALARVTDGAVVEVEEEVTTSGRWIGVRACASLDGTSVRLSDTTDAHETRERQERIEQEVAQLRRMETIGALVGGVAHDFNNLLSVINGTTELMREQVLDSKLRRDIDVVAEAGARGARLVRQLMSFARPELGGTTVDVSTVVADLAQLLQRTLGEDIELGLDLDRDLPTVRIDPGNVEQIVMNLAVNARAAMPGGGRLLIHTGVIRFDETNAALYPPLRAGYHVELSVTDTGMGMDPETRRRAFEPFYSTKPRGQGTGLGLSTVYGIITAAGGAISIYSELNLGTSMRIWFPVAEANIARIEALDDQDIVHGAGQRVLIVEDEPDLRELSVRLLENAGYDVRSAGDIRDAQRRIVTDDRLCLVVSDVIMPGGSGAELARMIARERPDVRVLFMSGYTDQFLNARDERLEEISLLRKPFSRADLLRAVRDALASRAPHAPA